MTVPGTRRAFLISSAAAAAAAAELTTERAAAADPAGAAAERCAPPPPAAVLGPKDPRYTELATRGYNARFAGRPDSIRLVHSTEQVVAAVAEAVRSKRRVAVRSGGHCFENFVDDPAVRLLIDLSEMNRVTFDARRRAFCVEAGATLGQVYRTLYLTWGVTVPAGGCPSVGAGGHILGGGYGPLSHLHGLVSDHLHAVEVVVNSGGRVRSVVATGDPGDPARDLWWAHTGGGGGNFGVVTRYWLRSPSARGDDPARLLPAPPGTLREGHVSWKWSDLDERSFAALVRNYGRWHTRYASGGAPEERLQGGLTMYHKVIGEVRVDAKLDDAAPGAERLMGRYLAELTKGVDAPHDSGQSTSPWLKSTLAASFGPGGISTKSKSGFLRRPWSDAQIATVHRYLTRGGDAQGGSAAYLTSIGGKMNEPSPAARAMPHRDSALMAFYDATWVDPAQSEECIAWVRAFYRDVYASTGGVPVPDAANDGAFINYPDVDLADPRWNTSGVPWHTLYYKGNYARLQQVKAKWDPDDTFRHALSVRPPR
ncbi:FAD-binding protein [Spirillospora sp. NPDC127200]